MIVVDVNVIAYTLIAGEKTSEARTVLGLDPDWIVPDLWRDEFLNILATYVRQGGTSLEQAKKLWLSATGLFEERETQVNPIEILELADRYSLSAYDAQYLAAAVTLGVKLITEDKSLLRSVPQLCMTMRQFIESVTRD